MTDSREQQTTATTDQINSKEFTAALMEEGSKLHKDVEEQKLLD